MLGEHTSQDCEVWKGGCGSIRKDAADTNLSDCDKAADVRRGEIARINHRAMHILDEHVGARVDELSGVDREHSTILASRCVTSQLQSERKQANARAGDRDIIHPTGQADSSEAELGGVRGFDDIEDHTLKARRLHEGCVRKHRLVQGDPYPEGGKCVAAGVGIHTHSQRFARQDRRNG